MRVFWEQMMLDGIWMRGDWGVVKELVLLVFACLLCSLAMAQAQGVDVLGPAVVGGDGGGLDSLVGGLGLPAGTFGVLIWVLAGERKQREGLEVRLRERDEKYSLLFQDQLKVQAETGVALANLTRAIDVLSSRMERVENVERARDHREGR